MSKTMIEVTKEFRQLLAAAVHTWSGRRIEREAKVTSGTVSRIVAGIRKTITPEVESAIGRAIAGLEIAGLELDDADVMIRADAHIIADRLRGVADDYDSGKINRDAARIAIKQILRERDGAAGMELTDSEKRNVGGPHEIFPNLERAAVLGKEYGKIIASLEVIDAVFGEDAAIKASINAINAAAMELYDEALYGDAAAAAPEGL